MDYQPSTPVRVTERGQMKLGDVLRFTSVTGMREEIFVRELDEDRFATVVDVSKWTPSGSRANHLRPTFYADKQIQCPTSYPAATNSVEVIGHISDEQVAAMLADCLDCTNL